MGCLASNWRWTQALDFLLSEAGFAFSTDEGSLFSSSESDQGSLTSWDGVDTAWESLAGEEDTEGEDSNVRSCCLLWERLMWEGLRCFFWLNVRPLDLESWMTLLMEVLDRSGLTASTSLMMSQSLEGVAGAVVVWLHRTADTAEAATAVVIWLLDRLFKGVLRLGTPPHFSLGVIGVFWGLERHESLPM